jgi:hypothetical protein
LVFPLDYEPFPFETSCSFSGCLFHRPLYWVVSSQLVRRKWRYTLYLHFRLNQHIRSGRSFAMIPSVIPSETSWGKSNEPASVTIFTGLSTSSAARPYSDWSKQTSSDPVYRPTLVLDRRVRGQTLWKAASG